MSQLKFLSFYIIGSTGRLNGRILECRFESYPVYLLRNK
nr:MAG TPA: hypothetical protein [Caudoviricetes sp.]